MLVATISSFLGSLWFALLLGCVGFGGGWWFRRKSCGKCKGK